MKNIDKLFTIEDGILIINKEEVRAIPEFKTILVRDKGKKEVGDADGRKKFFAFKELMFVYLYSSVYSIHINLPKESRLNRCKTTAGLNKDWRIDEVIKNACNKLESLEKSTPLRHAYIGAKRAIHSLGEDLDFFNTQKESIRKKIKEAYEELSGEENAEEIERLELAIDTLSTRLLTLGNKILTLANNLPSQYETLKDFEKKLLKEQEGGAGIYGGGKLGSREQ